MKTEMNRAMPTDDLVGYLSPTTLAAAYGDIYGMINGNFRDASYEERATLSRLRLALLNVVGEAEASRMISDAIA